MKVRLICSEANLSRYQEALSAGHLAIDDQAEVAVVERGQPIPERGIVILCGPDDLSDFQALVSGMSSQSETKKPRNTLPGKKGESYRLLALSDILFFEADGNTVYGVAADGRYEVSGKLYEVEMEFVGQGFIRVGKSLVVNIVHVQEVFPWFGGRLLLKLKTGQKEIEVSRNYVRDFKDYLGL